MQEVVDMGLACMNECAIRATHLAVVESHLAWLPSCDLVIDLHNGTATALWMFHTGPWSQLEAKLRLNLVRIGHHARRMSSSGCGWDDVG